MKIDYEITVNVEGLSHGEKKRVQDAFFKLGLTWWAGAKYSCLDKDCYTNKTMPGRVTQDLMWAYASTKTTHTIDQLMELAGMKTKIDLIPFDLEKALAGDPVVTRDGRAATQITKFECSSHQHPVAAVVDGKLVTYMENGRELLFGNGTNLDLFMKPKTRIINGFEVPAPETKAPDYGTQYFFPQTGDDDFYDWNCWEGDDIDNRILSRNILFPTKEAAIANAKAMLGIDPYGDND